MTNEHALDEHSEYIGAKPVTGPDQQVDVQKIDLGFAMSNEIGDLMGALSKAQSGMTTATKSMTGQIQNRKYQYADLEAVHNACRKQLTDNGIAVVNFPYSVNNEVVTVTTMLAKGEQWVRCSLTVDTIETVGAGVQTVQGMGAVITYCLRYNLAALAGVASSEIVDGLIDTQPPRQPNDGGRSVPEKTPEKKESKLQKLTREMKAMVDRWSEAKPEHRQEAYMAVFVRMRMDTKKNRTIKEIEICTDWCRRMMDDNRIFSEETKVHD